MDADSIYGLRGWLSQVPGWAQGYRTAQSIPLQYLLSTQFSVTTFPRKLAIAMAGFSDLPDISSATHVHAGHNITFERAEDSLSRRRNEVLKWLSPLHPREDHKQVRGKAAIFNQSNDPHRGYTPGQWLLSSGEFDQWESQELQKLWYIGMPGAGKSVLASVIIQHLLENTAGPRPGRERGRIAYLYLKYDAPQKIEHLIGSIIRQIIGRDALPQPLKDLWAGCNNGYDVPSEDELSSLLREVARDSRTYIVIDALDECAVQYRTRFLKVLGVNDSYANFLITSRYLDGFEGVAEGFTTRQIAANHDDLDFFIDYKIRTEDRLKRRLEHDDRLQLEVKHQVRDRCSGMFLLASMHMQSLATALTRGEFKELLRNLPRAINDAYMLTLTRIEDMESNKRKLALDSLCWIVYAQRQFTIQDLQYALAVDPGNGVFDKDRIPEPNDLRDLCHGLVTVVDDKVGLVHYTAQSFLDDHMKNKAPDFDAVMAQTCINYLSTCALELNRLSWSYMYEQPFLLYAGEYLAYHLQKLSESHGLFQIIFDSLKDLLTDRQKRKLLHCLLIETRGSDEDNLSLESLSGLESYDNSPNPEENEDLRQRLFEELQRFFEDGDEAYIREYLEDEDKDYMRMLSTAFRQSQRRSLFPVPDQHAEEDFQTLLDEHESSALHVASFLGWAPSVAYFADESLDLNTQDVHGRTPLTIAIRAKSWTVIPILLDRGACIDLSTPQGHAILLHCAQRNQKSVVEDLISGKPNSPAAQEELQIYKTTYHMFFQLDYSSLLLVLWGLGMNILHFILTPLSRVSRDKDSTTEGQTTTAQHDRYIRLLRAAVSGQHETIEVLMHGDQAIPRREDSAMFIRTALFLATEYGNLECVRVLLRIGPKNSVNMRGLDGVTLLHRAAWRNDVGMVRLLLEHTANPNFQDDFGHTPWSQNVKTEYKQVLLALVKGGADPNKRGYEGVSNLYLAAACGSLVDVKLSLECGVDPSIRTIYDWTPLHWAAASGHFLCVQELLAAGAEHSPVSDQSKTPLDMVLGRPERMAIEKILRDAGALTMREILDKKTSVQADLIELSPGESPYYVRRLGGYA
ncbi:hypothetical protein KCU65_g5575, partial [Aureobasidium melanogenum]